MASNEQFPNNHLQHSQAVGSKGDYESRISHLNQQIRRLNIELSQTRRGNSRLAEEKKNWIAQRAKHNDELFKRERKSIREKLDLERKLDIMKNDYEYLWNQKERYKDKFERTQKENDTLAMKAKKKLGDDSIHSFQISELQRNNKTLREKNEMLNANAKDRANELEASKSSAEKLKTELDCKETELQQLNQKVSKAEDENSELTQQLREIIEKLKETEDHLGRAIVYDATMNCNSHQSQISNLEAEIKKLKEENENLKQECQDLECYRRELGLEKTKKDQLQADFDSLEAVLQESSQKLREVEDENSELVQELETAKSTANDLRAELDNQPAELQICRARMRNAEEECYELSFRIADLEDELAQNERETLRLQKLSNKAESANADLQKAKDAMSRASEERDRLKEELKTAGDSFETAMERIIKLELKLKVQQDKHTEEIDKVKENSVNSLQFKADLELAKVSIEELTIKNKKLADELSAKSAECERVSKLYNESLASQPRNVGKMFMNFPGPSSSKAAAHRNTVDLNATIDLTKTDYDDDMSPSSSKKKKSK
ncbi:hypothetical protein DdX_13808 [Ditylenchus destructor]|uniref:Uncharacterized protein n=1 Tax=Ditylenchus destructor TaxID=166010 RepID=A0AAD4MSB0_9BILA|nr:hypothetical protein DdX_13808 [Ditylenchus destructor]